MVAGIFDIACLAQVDPFDGYFQVEKLEELLKGPTELPEEMTDFASWFVKWLGVVGNTKLHLYDLYEELDAAKTALYRKSGDCIGGYRSYYYDLLTQSVRDKSETMLGSLKSFNAVILLTADEDFAADVKATFPIFAKTFLAYEVWYPDYDKEQLALAKQLGLRVSKPEAPSSDCIDGEWQE